MSDNLTVSAYFTRSHGRWMLVIRAPRWLVKEVIDAARDEAQNLTRVAFGSWGGPADTRMPYSFNLLFGDRPDTAGVGDREGTGTVRAKEAGFRAQVTEHPSGLATMPNEGPAVRTRMEHTLPLPRCCPVSGNPEPGSTVTIRYHAAERVLEVYALKAYLERYRGGHPDGTRNMEAMVQQIARDAAAALAVTVFVHAHLFLSPEQQMRLIVTAQPDGRVHPHEHGRLQPSR